MAILVNIGKRGFVLKEGFVKPGDTITLGQDAAEKLSRVYPKELKLIVSDVKEDKGPAKVFEPKVVETLAEPAKVEAVKAEEPKETVAPKKRTYKRKAK